MLKTKLSYISIWALCFLLFSLIQSNIILARTFATNVTDNPANTALLNEIEWWIEVEITPKGGEQEVNDNILLLLYDEFLSHKRENITSWHFFREPTLRFRIELTDKETRDNVAVELETFLDSIELVEDHYFAKHGQRIGNLDDGYSGEFDQYKRMWPAQKKLWEWGSEMTVEAIKEFKETGTNDPSREYQLKRIFHLLSLQLLPEYEQERYKDYIIFGFKLGVIVTILIIVAIFAFAKTICYIIEVQKARRDTKSREDQSTK
jgi:hypothetical protein